MKMLAHATKRLERIIVRFGVLRFFAKLYYRPIVKKDIALADISRGDRVLFIGGGPLPLSAVMIERMSGARISVIDCDKTVLEHARLVSLKESCEFTCRYAEGAAIDVTGYTVVFVARGVQPRCVVLAHLLCSADEGTRIVYRYRQSPPEGGKLCGWRRKTCLFVV